VSVAIRVTGVNQFATLARDARRAGGNKVVDDLKREFRRTARKAEPLIRESFTDKLPKRGGYADLVLRTVKVRAKFDTGFTTASMSIATRAKGRSQLRDLPSLNNGVLRHPPWGRRERAWVSQKIPPGMWDDAAEIIENFATDDAVVALNNMARRLAGKE
jgi:hypothetical protein